MLAAQGNYPVVREDASQMCALQIQAEHASTLNDNEEQVMACIEKYITKQARAAAALTDSRPQRAGAQRSLCPASTVNSGAHALTA